MSSTIIWERTNKTHVLNLLHRLVDGAPIDQPDVTLPAALSLNKEPRPMSHYMTGYAPREEHVMRHDPTGAAIVIMMRSLKIPLMAQAVQELHEQGSPAFDAAIPTLSRLLQAEIAERKVHSIAYHMKAARFPAYKDISGFDFGASEVGEALVRQLHRCEFMEAVKM